MKKSVPILVMSAVLIVLIVSLAVSYEIDTYLEPDEVKYDTISEMRSPDSSKTDIVTDLCDGFFEVSVEVNGGGFNYVQHSVANSQTHGQWRDAIMDFSSASVILEYVDNGNAEGMANCLFAWPWSSD